jgi:hypothetical protein
MPSAPVETIHVDARDVRITNPDKALFPERGYTKLDIVCYYSRHSQSATCRAATGAASGNSDREASGRGFECIAR